MTRDSVFTQYTHICIHVRVCVIGGELWNFRVYIRARVAGELLRGARTTSFVCKTLYIFARICGPRNVSIQLLVQYMHASGAKKTRAVNIYMQKWRAPRGGGEYYTCCVISTSYYLKINVLAALHCTDVYILYVFDRWRSLRLLPPPEK